MSNRLDVKKILVSGVFAAAFIICGVSAAQAQARDPFAKPGWAKPRTTGAPTTPNSSNRVKGEKPKPAGPPPVVTVTAPPIESRINYYKQLREQAALNGQEIPKVTSVLTIDEMSVVGIFRTPRGVAAMVEAKPIKLSYTIYPGEKFFDGQLVAIEENRLVFRRVTKMSNNKFVSSVENKTLRQYSVEQEVQGTAPIQQTPQENKPEEARNNTVLIPQEGQQNPSSVMPTVVISPLEEMLRQPPEPVKTEKSTKDKNGKKPVKVAKNKNQ